MPPGERAGERATDALFVLLVAIDIFRHLNYVPALGRVNMTAQEMATVAAASKDIATAVALIVGGVWALRRFWRERESIPRLQLDLDASVLSTRANSILVAITAHIENKGRVRHEIRKFDFVVIAIDDGALDVVQAPATFNAPTKGTVKIEGSLMPSDADYSFVEPGVKSGYFEFVALPPGCRVMHVYTRFDYAKQEYEEAECVAVIPCAQKRKLDIR